MTNTYINEGITPMTELMKNKFQPTLHPSKVIDTLKKYILVDGFEIILDLDKSRGCYIYDAKTQSNYLDLFSFVASNPVGMNHPKLYNSEFINYIGRIAVNKPSNSDIYCVELADFIETFFKIAVPDYFKHAFFIEGGALAVENAIKAAFDWKIRKNFKKGYKNEVGKQVIHFKKAFHGRSGYTMSLTNQDPVESIKVALYPKFNWPRVTPPVMKFPVNENNLDEVMKLEDITMDEMKNAVMMNKDDIACLLIETIQGEGGDNHFRKEFFEKIRNFCDENEIMYIVDEIQTGIGMTGKMWAHQYYSQPDMITFGKKTQVCGVLSTDRIDDIEDNVFRLSGRLNSTWGGNLVDMIRSKRYLEIIQEDNLVENANKMGAYLIVQLKKLSEKYPDLVSNVRGLGLFCAIDLPNTEMRELVREKAMKKHAIILGSGFNSIRFRPPLVISEKEIDEATGILDECLDEISKSK